MGISASTEVSYTVPTEERGWHELSIAIVKTAVDDYRNARKAVFIDEKNMSAQVAVDSLRTFFLSEVFENISGISCPVAFLQRLDDDIEIEHERGMRRKRPKKMMVFK